MPGNRPFRFGVGLVGATTGADWLVAVRRAEELGYATVVLPDHLQDQLAPIASLATAAQATQTLRVGSYVLVNDFRHPAMLAKEAATIDLLSGGRLELGLGAGWRPADYDQIGLTFDPAGRRVGRLEEALTIIKGLFGEAPLSFAGRHYTVRDMAGTPRPAQRPHPPIMVAGGGRRMLTMAAREADIVGLLPSAPSDGSDPAGNLADGTAEATARKVAWVREAAGPRFDALELNVMVRILAVTVDRVGMAERLGARLGTTATIVLESPYCLVGTVDQIVEDLLARRELYGISYLVVVGARHMEAFAPVVARLAGR